jgi:hypothetical protein
VFRGYGDLAEPCEEERSTVFWLWGRYSIFNAIQLADLLYAEAMEAVVCGPSRRGHQFSSYENLAISDLLFYYAFKQIKASKG